MNNKLALLFFVAVSMLLWNSCSVTKRYHNRGFYINFGFKNKAVENPKVAISKASADSTSFEPILESVSKTPADVYTPNEEATENSIFFEAQRNDLDVAVPDTGISKDNRAVEEEIAAKKKESDKRKVPTGTIFFGFIGILALVAGVAITTSTFTPFALGVGKLLIIGGLIYLAIAVLILFLW